MWNFISISSGNQIAKRRNHTSVIAENNMYVYGGIDVHGKYLNDMWILSLKVYQWH